MSLDPILAAAGELEDFCRSRSWQFCFIGGLAVQRWGEPRFTAHADLTLLTGFGLEQSFIDPLCAHFQLRRADAREIALQHRVLLIQAANGTPLDVALGAVPFEVNSVRRASPFAVGTGRILTTCSAEDLLVHKVVANREKDWIDVEGVLARQWNKLDLLLFRREVEPLLELGEDPDTLARFDRLHAKLERRFGS
jgi:hypothetical protein